MILRIPKHNISRIFWKVCKLPFILYKSLNYPYSTSIFKIIARTELDILFCKTKYFTTFLHKISNYRPHRSDYETIWICLQSWKWVQEDGLSIPERIVQVSIHLPRGASVLLHWFLTSRCSFSLTHLRKQIRVLSIDCPMQLSREP